MLSQQNLASSKPRTVTSETISSIANTSGECKVSVPSSSRANGQNKLSLENSLDEVVHSESRYRSVCVSDESEDDILSLLYTFGEDACIQKASTGPGIMLDKSQSALLDQSWRIVAPGRLSAYKVSYRFFFPVRENAEEGLKVPSLDNIVKFLLIKRHSTRVVFKKIEVCIHNI